jgi:hypothetical protein
VCERARYVQRRGGVSVRDRPRFELAGSPVGAATKATSPLRYGDGERALAPPRSRPRRSSAEGAPRRSEGGRSPCLFPWRTGWEYAVCVGDSPRGRSSLLMDMSVSVGDGERVHDRARARPVDEVARAAGERSPQLRDGELLDRDGGDGDAPGEKTGAGDAPPLLLPLPPGERLAAGCIQ